MGLKEFLLHYTKTIAVVVAAAAAAAAAAAVVAVAVAAVVAVIVVLLISPRLSIFCWFLETVLTSSHFRVNQFVDVLGMT